jgi:HSP90 family molecular chaperone
MDSKGTIGVSTQDLFPIIKKFLYSDHEIFLREIVSNAVDATQKLRALAIKGEYKDVTDGLKVRVWSDAAKGTITVSDNGIGMTAEEVEKYINQIAFSGAEEFLAKYKDTAATIIGHFGLGFYSSFMVSDKVEIITRSYRDNEKAVRWICEGTTDYTMEEAERDTHGTDIIMYLNKDELDFVKEEKIEELLKKYCRFLPVEIIHGKEKEWKDGKYIDTDKDHIVNDTKPLWTRKPSELTDEDYNKFYHELYPFAPDPLFHIHLNVDFPFTLTGVLYFPKIENRLELTRNKIGLYANQVYVTDSVEGIVPDYLTLLHGVIDSPDIPLNVSRSYLQSDRSVKQISTHITKKVADMLLDLYKNERADYESKWDDLKIFVQYGVLSDEKFAERAVDLSGDDGGSGAGDGASSGGTSSSNAGDSAGGDAGNGNTGGIDAGSGDAGGSTNGGISTNAVSGFYLLKNVDNKYYGIKEYISAVKGSQTDKDGKTVLLYTFNATEQYAYVEGAKVKGYDVLVMNSPLDTPFFNYVEQKNDKVRFVRVDSEVAAKLIPASTDVSANILSSGDEEMLREIFASQLQSAANGSDMSAPHYHIEFCALGSDSAPAVITRSEFMRRMKEMSEIQPAMNFYGKMGDQLSVVVNTDSSAVKKVLAKASDELSEKIKPLNEKSAKLNADKADIDMLNKDVKKEDIPQADKDRLDKIDKDITAVKVQKDELLRTYGKEQETVGQIIDLALLSNGLLKGEALAKFLKRSAGML